MTVICLDLDGTLEDSRADMVSAVQRVRAQLHLSPRPDEIILPWVNKGMDQLYRSCFDDFIREDQARYKEVQQRYEADYKENVAVETKLYPGMAKGLEALSELGKMAVVTNKPERISEHLLDTLGVRRLFTAVIGGDTCTKTKPDPVVLSEACKRCGWDGSGGDVWMIGDSSADIKMGKFFGAKTIWCRWGYSDRPGSAPDFIAEKPEDLPDTVRKHIIKRSEKN